MISMEGTVTEGFTEEEETDLVEDIAEVYNVSTDDVDLTVDYVTRGTLNVTIPEELSEEEAIAALTSAIAAAVGVHEKDVTVTIDLDGVVHYEIAGDSYEEAAGYLNLTTSDTFLETLGSELEAGDSGIVVASVDSDDEVVAVVTGTSVCSLVLFGCNWCVCVSDSGHHGLNGG